MTDSSSQFNSTKDSILFSSLNLEKDSIDAMTTTIHLQTSPLTSNASSPLSPTLLSFKSVQENDLKVLKQYILNLENILENNETQYGIIRKKLQEYLEMDSMRRTPGPEKVTSRFSELEVEPLKPKKLSLFRSDPLIYNFKVPPESFGTYLFGPDANQKIFALLANKKWLFSFVTLAICSLPILYLVLLLKINPWWGIFLFTGAIFYGPLILLINPHIFLQLLHSFEFWYVVLNAVAYSVEICILLDDPRMSVPIAQIFGVWWFCCSDAAPPMIRKFGGNLTSMAMITWAITLFCVHYNFFPFLQDRTFNISEMHWTVKQLLYTSSLNLFIYFLRYFIFGFLRPKELMMLRAGVIVEETSVS